MAVGSTTTATADAVAAPAALQASRTSSARDRFLRARADLVQLGVEDADFGGTLERSLEVVRQALDKFGPDRLAISFNGGKDACVVFYLLLMVLAERDEVVLICRFGAVLSGKGTHLNEGIPVVYFQKEEFPEIDDFMRELSHMLGFEFRSYAMSYRDGMQDLVEEKNIEAVIMGQRRGDPWTEDMEFFTQSTPGWPNFTRVNPVLDWKFHHVWRFLRGARLPYCCLYDQGYTSLGERRNTAKNEALRLPSGEYRPAYELAEEHLERSPRSSRNEAEKSKAEVESSSVEYYESESVTAAGAIHVTKRCPTWHEKWNFFFGDGAVDGEISDQSRPTDSSERAGAGGEVVVVPEAGSCVASAGGVEGRVQNEAGLVWVGGGTRWLPATALVVVVLASFGLRRAGMPVKGS